MNESQMAQQIRHVLATATWPESPSRLVFGERMAFVVAGMPDEDELPGGFPFALVNIGGGTSDPDDPNLLEQNFTVLTVADVSGGRMGEQALVGGAKSALGTSANRGVLELNARVRDALKDLKGSDGAALQLSATSAGSPVRLGRGRHMAIGESSFTGWTTAAPSYTAPSRLAVSSTTWTWTGGQCSSRFDFIRYRLGYVAGAVPAKTPEDLDTIVYTGTNATATHTPVSSKTYSIFADYGTRGGTAIDGSSDGRELGANHST
tara:strand:- start:4544 stop:5332 length:789 start_codon:yes stop_codon:yes gene_type:complete